MMDISILFSILLTVALLGLIVAYAIPRPPKPDRREDWEGGDPGPYYERDPKSR
jgi:hypothetical protein